MRRLIDILLLSVIPLLFTCCFTGIENAPKITAGDLRREHINGSSPEQTTSDRIRPQSLATWNIGQRFIVTDEKIKLVFSSSDFSILPHRGDTIIYTGIYPVTSVMGGDASAITFIGVNNPDTLVYRVETSPEELKSRQAFTVPFTINLQLVELADSILRGRELYVTTPYWYNSSFSHVTGRKFVKVKINRVIAGNSDYPLAIDFTDDKGSNKIMLLTAGGNSSSSRNFANLFSFSNPRLRYPNISDENWDAIINGRVVQYMTRDEARLALGQPDDVMYGQDHNFSYERWVYPNGTYLIFEDGLLKSYKM